MYSNPENPFICPILSLARYISSNPSILQGNCTLFESSDPYQRYIKDIRSILEKYVNIFLDLGVDIDDLGSHSVRKGSASKCSTGSTVSPPMVSICLRAG